MNQGNPPFQVDYSTDCSSCAFTSSGWTGMMTGTFAGGPWDGELDGEVTTPDRVWKITGSGTFKSPQGMTTQYSFQDSTINEFVDPADGKTKWDVNLTYLFANGITQVITTPTKLVRATGPGFETVIGPAKLDVSNDGVINVDFTLQLNYTTDLSAGTISSTLLRAGMNTHGTSNRGTFSISPAPVQPQADAVDASTNITVTDVPEPSTLIPLGCIGIAALASRLRLVRLSKGSYPK